MDYRKLATKTIMSVFVFTTAYSFSHKASAGLMEMMGLDSTIMLGDTHQVKCSNADDDKANCDQAHADPYYCNKDTAGNKGHYCKWKAGEGTKGKCLCVDNAQSVIAMASPIGGTDTVVATTAIPVNSPSMGLRSF